MEIVVYVGLAVFVLLVIIVMMFWYVDQRRTNHILAQYKSDMDQLRRMYENNISLVNRYAKLSDDLSLIIATNTKALTELVESMRANQYCPLMRKKE